MMKTRATNRWVVPVLIAILIVVLWSTRILPSGLCVFVASKYVRDHYPIRRYEYSFVEYSSAHGEYFVHFVDEEGNRLALMVRPYTVMYDPLNPPG